MELTREEIDRYDGYHKLPAFEQGFKDYEACGCDYSNHDADSVDGQAYDRGAECAMRRARKPWPAPQRPGQTIFNR